MEFLTWDVPNSRPPTPCCCCCFLWTTFHVCSSLLEPPPLSSIVINNNNVLLYKIPYFCIAIISCECCRLKFQLIYSFFTESAQVPTLVLVVSFLRVSPHTHHTRAYIRYNSSCVDYCTLLQYLPFDIKCLQHIFSL